mmetsp:Transcript_98494/g.195372  ORF Transcript_98494/g.195372 Transcript_98494/m.195372 type:complete len:133 (+) Transcript_98494:438-836(+)
MMTQYILSSTISTLQLYMSLINWIDGLMTTGFGLTDAVGLLWTPTMAFLVQKQTPRHRLAKWREEFGLASAVKQASNVKHCQSWPLVTLSVEGGPSSLFISVVAVFSMNYFISPSSPSPPFPELLTGFCCCL